MIDKGVLLQIIESDVSHGPSLPSVDTGEIAFAMALFVAAAKGTLRAPNIGVSGFPANESRFDLDDSPLDSQDLPGDAAETSSESVPLSRAVSVLWHHYKGDERQRTIWCRVVAFHVMLVSCQGSLLEEWTKPCREEEDSAFLDPAIVYAVATASLSEFGQFSDALFLEAVKQFTGPPAFASEPDSLVAREMPQFRIFESLRRSVADLGGRRAFESLLSRALVGPTSKFPWLRSVQQLTPSELFERIDQSDAYPSMIEAKEAESAVVNSLLELLKVLLGESVTMRLLQNAWAQEDVRREGFEGK
jgi:hypothetical protein